MNNDLHRETAKIYAFPSRAETSRRSVISQSAPVADLLARRLPRTDFGSGWYHEAAMQEEVVTAKQ